MTFRSWLLGLEKMSSVTLDAIKLSQIAYMDHTPLPFSFTNGEAYTDIGDKTVWIWGGALGMDKRQWYSPSDPAC